ncbi:hypothetical protein [Novipirellula rosea]|uniref:HEAT repeat domain-containing protein n=1 Tax=Novipirellula rosea TaxID=1031540 RepID=A0ABP8MNH4_9BACT
MNFDQDQSPDQTPNESWNKSTADLEAKKTIVLENARSLIERAKEERESLPQVELRQRAIASLGSRAQGVQVVRLVLHPLAGNVSDAGREKGIEQVIAMILEACESNPEVSWDAGTWSVYAGFAGGYVIRRGIITELAHRALKMKWSLIEGKVK